jgi:hypothetical protein
MAPIGRDARRAGNEISDKRDGSDAEMEGLERRLGNAAPAIIRAINILIGSPPFLDAQFDQPREFVVALLPSP